MSEYHKEYYQKNREKLLEQGKQNYLQNRKKKIEQAAKRNKTHREEHNAAAAKWRKNNPQKHLEQQRRRRAKKYGCESGPVFTLEELINFYGNYCMYPGCERSDLTIDHIVPLSIGGAHVVWNQQILCVMHNCSKGNRNCTDYRPFIVVDINV